MKKHILLFVTLLFCSALGTPFHREARAEVLTIKAGAIMALGSATLDVNCREIVVKSGGILDLQNGTLLDKGTVTVEPGGIFSSASGTVVPCGGNVYPVVTAGQSFSVPEDSANGYSPGTIVATDEDAGTVFSNWIILSGNDDNIFALNSSTGEITVADNTNLDYQTRTAYTLSVTVSDGTDTSDPQDVIVNVLKANTPPVLDPIGDRIVNELTQLTFTATAIDNDPGDTVSFSLSGAPAGASIGAQSGIFTWTPTESQGPGDYTFTVQVRDNGLPSLTDSENITVTVHEVTAPPAIALITNKSVPAESLLTFTASASDSDIPANTLTFSLSGLPVAAAIDPQTGVFTWTPAVGDMGDHSATITVNDGTTDASRIFIITVTSVNRPPTFDGTPTITGTPHGGATLGLTDAGASDADGDSVTLSYQWTADGIDIDGATAATFVVTAAVNGKTIACHIIADDGRGGSTGYTTAGVTAHSFPWLMFIHLFSKGTGL
ncbi:MAG: putative Ig domain-containing protein [Pseudomonadota bacterium]